MLSKTVQHKRPAVFLDRDGVICKALPRGEYLIDWSQFEPLEGIHEFLDEAQKKGYLIFVVTNQGAIAKGLLAEEKLIDIHEKMAGIFKTKFNAIYYCPHHDVHGCECRKPKSGMLRSAEQEFNVDPARSFMIGDSDKDIGAGREFGAKTVFLKNEFNTHELAKCEPDFIVDTLLEALQHIPHAS